MNTLLTFIAVAAAAVYAALVLVFVVVCVLARLGEKQNNSTNKGQESK